jgi:hypothetical protein
MSIKADAPPPAVGVYWIDEADYSTLRDLFEDGNKMPPTWKEWLKMAEEMKRGLESYGHPVMRVRIDPRTLPRSTKAICCCGRQRAIRRPKLEHDPEKWTAGFSEKIMLQKEI